MQENGEGMIMGRYEILVTGGKKFIGSNLVKELKKGHEVWVCDLHHSEGERDIYCEVIKYR